MIPEEDLIQQRKKKLEEIKALNIDPYPTKFDKKDSSSDLIKKFKSIKQSEKTKTKVSIAGRLIALRGMGKVCFGDIQDYSGKIQFYAKEEETTNYSIIKKVDIGDFIGIKGIVFKTKMGEVSIWVKSIELLTKSLRPLPEKFHGLKDPELRYRQRYLDLIMNPEVKKTFEIRNQVINYMREFLVKNNFIEVQTPVLQPIYGGTNARPFESKLNALSMKVYLRISNELYLKRLIAGGYEKIFEFSQDFRNEGIDKTHNPEFLQMETMAAYFNYEDNIIFFENMIEYIVKKIFKTTKVNYQDITLDFKKPWNKMSMIEAVKKYTNLDFSNINLQDAIHEAKKLNIELKENPTKWEILDKIFEEKVEPELIQPTIIYDFPAELSPLAKKNPKNPEFAERFEPFVFGFELGNVYSELNDPNILRENWEKQKEFLKKGDLEAQPMDLDFIKTLEYGMPPTSGIGIGVDRLVMLLSNSKSIRDVIFFPFMRPI